MRRSSPSNRCLPVAEWPQEDQTAWRQALLPADPFDPSSGLASRWRPATQAMIAGSYGRWLGWLALTGALDPGAAPGSRVCRAQVKAYRDALRAGDLADHTIAGHINHLGDALMVIAPAGDWAWLKLAGSRLHADAVPRRDVLSIMQPLQDLLRLGHDLMEAAEAQRFRTPLGRATLFRDGLILNLLTLRPLRMANFASLTLGENLENRNGWRIHIQAGATKGSAVIDCAWPDMLLAALERYLTLHREVLLQCSPTNVPSQALWISKRGAPMGSDALTFQIKDRTQEEFGKAINPHTFRHIAATAVATSDPTESAAIALILGHKSMRASEKYYNRAQILGAAERLQDTIAHLRLGGT